MTDTPDRGRLTWWSLISLAAAVPTWWFIITSSVVWRGLDGGLFLSVVGGMEQGLTLYRDIFEVKDPLFFGTMWGAHQVTPIGPFFTDVLWLAVAGVGAWLMARAVTSPDRALFVGLVAVPLVLVGPFYAAGHSNTPGTAMVLLGLGLALNRRGVGAGVVIGLLLFTKALVWPLGLIPLLLLLLWRTWRGTAVRGIVAGGATVAAALIGLWVLGMLGPYVDVLRWNSSYSFTVMEYFGYESSFTGHFGRLIDQWDAVGWVAVGAALLVTVGVVVRWTSSAVWRTPERDVLTVWLPLLLLGTAGVIGLSYIWQHHSQLYYLPAAVAVVALPALIPDRWPVAGVLPLVLLGAWVLGAWGAPTDAWNRVQSTRDAFTTRWAEIDEQPKDAVLLSTVPMREFTYARLGTNDDRGYLLSAPSGATLACPQFHMYDFSPDEEFVRMLECIQDVDVVLLTDNFVVFGNGGKAPVVQPILQYVEANFSCIRVDDRQICTRRSL